MPRFPDIGGQLARRAILRLLLPVVLVTAGIRDLAAEEKREDEKNKVALSPEMEEKFSEFLKRAAEAKRKIWAERMKREIARIAKATGLGAEESKALEATAAQAVDACIDGWTAKLNEIWRGYFSNMLEEEFAVDQMLSQTDQAAQSDWFGDYVRPYEHPKWEEAVRRTLSADQITVWGKAQTERTEAVRKETAEILKASVERSSEQQRLAFAAKGATIAALLALPKDRAEKLEALAKTVADAGAEAFRKRGERVLLDKEDVQLREIMKTRQFYLQEEGKYLEAQQTAWIGGVGRVLSEDERKGLKEKQDAAMAKRAVVMGKVMITLLDDRIAFTESQRERLQPIAERLMKDQKTLFDDGNFQPYTHINAQAFFAAGAKATEEELKPILDPNQLKHWQEVSIPKNYRPNQRVVGGLVVVRKSEPVADSKSTPSTQEPEDMENALSDYFHAQSINQRKQLLATNLLMAEDAARVAGLAPEAVSRLGTAARGITEVGLAAWKGNTEQNIRSQLRDATAENVKQQLANMGSYSYSRRSALGSAIGPIWDQTVKTELTNSQRAAWQKELDARIGYRAKAIASVILSEFDRKITLTAGQWTKLEPIIAGTVKDYTPDIETMFSSNYPYSWFLQSYTMFIPIAAVPEADMKGILSKEQWDGWKGSPEMENTNNYWENVQNNHKSRMKEKRE